MWMWISFFFTLLFSQWSFFVAWTHFLTTLFRSSPIEFNEQNIWSSSNACSLFFFAYVELNVFEYLISMCVSSLSVFLLLLLCYSTVLPCKTINVNMYDTCSVVIVLKLAFAFFAFLSLSHVKHNIRNVSVYWHAITHI